MRYLTLAVVCATTLFFGGCTKQETTQNLRNVRDGAQNTWDGVKKDVSRATQEFKEETR